MTNTVLYNCIVEAIKCNGITMVLIRIVTNFTVYSVQHILLIG